MRLGYLIVTIRSSCLVTLRTDERRPIALRAQGCTAEARVKKHIRFPVGWPGTSRRYTTVRRRIRTAARASSSMSSTGHKAQIEAPALLFDTEEQCAK